MDWKKYVKSILNMNVPTLSVPTKAIFKYKISGETMAIKAEFIRCTNCYLTVHGVCYGVDVDNVSTQWLCDRCKTNLSVTVSNTIYMTWCAVKSIVYYIYVFFNNYSYMHLFFGFFSK